MTIEAITFDFGNTLVPVPAAGLRGVVAQTAERIGQQLGPFEADAVLQAWSEERERQFREEVPQFREVDIRQRAVRVLARLRGLPPPTAESRWDDEAAARRVAAGEVNAVVDAYSGAFVARIAPVADATATIERLAARGFALAILSNWPLALTVDRFAATQGWLPYLRTIVVSQRVGTIKPHPLIFRAAEQELGFDGPAGGRILHVGDDWAADVVGASQAGWRTAYLRNRQLDTPLPTSEPGGDLVAGAGVVPDLVIDELSDLDPMLEPLAATSTVG